MSDSDVDFFKILGIALAVNYKFILSIIEIISMMTNIGSIWTPIGIQVLLMCILSFLICFVFYFIANGNDNDQQMLEKLKERKIIVAILSLGIISCYIAIWVTYFTHGQTKHNGIWVMWMWEFWNFLGLIILLTIGLLLKTYDEVQKYVAKQAQQTVNVTELTTYRQLEPDPQKLIP